MDIDQVKKKVKRIKDIQNKFIRVQKLLELSLKVQAEREKQKLESLKHVLEQNRNRPSPIKWD